MSPQIYLSSVVSWLVLYLKMAIAILSARLTTCDHLCLCEFSKTNKSLGELVYFLSLCHTSNAISETSSLKREIALFINVPRWSLLWHLYLAKEVFLQNLYFCICETFSLEREIMLWFKGPSRQQWWIVKTQRKVFLTSLCLGLY